jgi:toxin CcdB
MARYDVYAHPDPVLARKTPFLLDVQNSFLDTLGTRVVLPLRVADYLPYPVRDINPSFTLKGKKLILDTAAIAAFPAQSLMRPVDHWQKHSHLITQAMDTLFGGY